MAYDAKTQRLISLKKLAGKAQTSNDKDLANEGLPSGITLASNTIFGESISTAPSDSSLYTITGKVEYVRFPVTFIAGSDTSDGRHGFELKLPSDYESNSSNSKAGTYPFINNQIINITSGALQLVPPSFATSYEAKPYYGGTASKDSGTQIPILDARDWYLDYFNGILFQQDPPGTGDHAENPDYVEAYLYIGKMLDSEVNNAGESFFTSPSVGYINTSGSAAFAGSLGSSYTPASVGTDASFFVSGAIDSKGTGERGTAVFGGDLAVSGALALNQGAADGSQVFVTTEGKVGIGTSTPAYKLSVGGSMDVGEYIYHKNDTDTFIQFADDAIGVTAGGEQLITISEAPTFVKIGDGGDVDFQVRTLGDDNTLYVQGDTDRVGIGTNSPSSILHIKETGPVLTLQRENNSNGSTINFVGAAGSTANSIIHDSSTNDLVFKTFNGSTVEEILRVGDHYGVSNRQVIFLSGSGMHPAATQPRHAADIAFFVSGAMGSRGTTNKGVSVFGGDIVASGTTTLGLGLTIPGATPIMPSLIVGSSTVSGGTDIGIFFSGSIGQRGTPNTFGTTSFGGDTVVSGTLYGGNILPESDNVYDLGGMSNRWANIYTGDLHLKNERGDWTIVEEAEYLSVINNLTGKKYKMVLEPIE